MAARGCGTRVKGGIYAETRLSEDGQPVEYFLVDPPQAVPVDALGVSPVGVTLIERDGVTHLLDWVGSSHYPNVADFVEEVRRLGASRRLSRTLDFTRLTAASRLLLLHARADIVNAEDYYRAVHWDCPKNIESHGADGFRPDPPVMCAGLWWQDLDPDSPHVPVAGRHVERQAAVTYEAHLRPENMRPRYRPAIFMSLPITNLAVIRDPEDYDNEHRARTKASQAALPVLMEDE